MIKNFDKIINIEWKAQKLIKEQKKIGPTIESIVQIQSNTKSIEKRDFSSYSLICMQGSFDPPTLSHIDLLNKAIHLQKKLNQDKQVYFVILLSLSHVDKHLNAIERSLLGHRVEMLEILFHKLNLIVPVDIAISNVARYIDLKDAIKKNYINVIPSFLMGIDVFKKLFDSVYYSQSIENVIPSIFEAKYMVAGRNEIDTKKKFNEFLKEKINKNLSYTERISFFTLSKPLRSYSSSEFRKKFERSENGILKAIDPVIIDYIRQKNLYKFNLERIATQIIIQTIVRLALSSEIELSFNNNKINRFISEVNHNPQIQKLVISEYRQDMYSTIVRMWNEL